MDALTLAKISIFCAMQAMTSKMRVYVDYRKKTIDYRYVPPKWQMWGTIWVDYYQLRFGSRKHHGTQPSGY